MFIETIPEDAATGETAEYYRHRRDSWGFLPNYAGAFSHRPEVAQAWNALNLAIRGGMDRRRFELATIAAARALRSTYCTAAHSMVLRDVCGAETSLHRLPPLPAGEALDEQDRALYRFAAKSPRTPHQLTGMTSTSFTPLGCRTPISLTWCMRQPPDPSSRGYSMASEHSSTSRS